MVLRLRRQVRSLESDAAKTNHYAAKIPQSFRTRGRPCHENGDSLENVPPCVLSPWRKKAQPSRDRFLLSDTW